jgi:hypothetical protein
VNRRRTAWRAGLGLLAAATLLGAGPGARPADAQAPPPARTLVGIQGSAAATVLRAMYNPEGLLPLGTILELGIPDALATISSGPATFARAAAADPGDLLANPDALLQASGQAPGTLPAWPFRVSASSGVGAPTAELSPAPGIDTRVSADAAGSSALATMPAFRAPAVLTAGSAASTATTSTDGATVTVRARSELTGLDLLGLLRIESVVTELTAVTDGTTTTTSGGTVVTGATLAGQPVTIDSEGISSAQPGVALLNDVLETLGIRVTAASPPTGGEVVAGQLTSAGLRIDFEASQETFPVIGDVLDGLPPFPPLAPGAPSVDDVLAAARARHLVSLGIGGASVSLSARTPAPRPAPAAPGAPVAAPSAPTPAPPSEALRPSAVAAPPAPPTLAAAAPIATAPAPVSAPVNGLAQGIGALAVLALLVQPFVGDKLAKAAALLTDDGPADSCPREGT